MAIKPGDSRIPRYYEGNALPVFYKQSHSQAVCLYLLDRNIWSNLFRRLSMQNDHKPNITLLDTIGQVEQFKLTSLNYVPSHHGIIEGIIHVNPWLIKYGSIVMVEVTAKYHLTHLDLDEFDCEVNNVVFKQSYRVNPPKNYDETDPTASLKYPPSNLNTYSIQLRNLYNKLGGPVSGKYMEDEKLTSVGVKVNRANYSRFTKTVVPQTEATKFSPNPTHPYVNYNFPFRFDLNEAPDSVWLKNTNLNKQERKSKTQLFSECFYDKLNSEDESNNEFNLLENNDKFQLDKQINIKKPQKTKKQMNKDFNSDTKQTKHKCNLQKSCNGISWTVKAFVVESVQSKPNAEDIACLDIRKLTYVPQSVLGNYLNPSQSLTDYCWEVEPQPGFDGGLITLVAKLDKLIYTPGEIIVCDIKYCNSSVRIIHSLFIEFHQCISTATLPEQVWRSIICRKHITDLSLIDGMPTLPGTEDSRVRVQLNPWPSKLNLLKNLVKTFNQNNKIPNNIFYGQIIALESPDRYEPIETRHLLAPTSINTFSEKLKHSVSIYDEHIKEDKNRKCTRPCIFGHVQNFQKTKEPYQMPFCTKNVLYPCNANNDDDCDNNELGENLMFKLCTNDNPINVYYEVVVRAEILNHNKPNLISAESAIKQSGLGSGLLIDPHEQKIIIPKGSPEIKLPCLLSHKNPLEQMNELIKIPIGNHSKNDQESICDDYEYIESKESKEKILV